jgi:hypothetical protein
MLPPKKNMVMVINTAAVGINQSAFRLSLHVFLHRNSTLLPSSDAIGCATFCTALHLLC